LGENVRRHKDRGRASLPPRRIAKATETVSCHPSSKGDQQAVRRERQAVPQDSPAAAPTRLPRSGGGRSANTQRTAAPHAVLGSLPPGGVPRRDAMEHHHGQRVAMAQPVSAPSAPPHKPSFGRSSWRGHSSKSTWRGPGAASKSTLGVAQWSTTVSGRRHRPTRSKLPMTVHGERKTHKTDLRRPSAIRKILPRPMTASRRPSCGGTLSRRTAGSMISVCCHR